MTTPHPEPDALADLADLAGPPSVEQAETLAHVTECPTCTDELAALRDVRETLASLPPVTMPTEVADRIDAALRAARMPASGTIVPFTAPQVNKRARRAELPYAAAAAVVLLLALVGGIAVFAGNHGDSKKSATAAEAAPSAAAAATAPVGPATIIESGTNYTSTDIRNQVVAVVTSRLPNAAAQYPGLQPGLAAIAAGSSAAAPAAAAAPAFSAAAGATSAAPAAAASAPAAAPALPSLAAAPLSPNGPLADPSALAACVQTLAGRAEQPVLVDYATFNGVPSTVLVLPDPEVAGKLDIYVEANTADCANQEFTFAAFLPPPSSPGS